MGFIADNRPAYPGEDIPGPFHVTLVVGVPGRPDCLVSVIDTDTLAGVRDFLCTAAESKVLHRYAEGYIAGIESLPPVSPNPLRY